jgi:hypothetical protein
VIDRALVRILVVAVIAGAVAPAPVDAQPRAGGRGSGSGAVDRKERIKKRIRALRAVTLTDELGLDDVTAGKLFTTLNKYDDELGKRLIERTKLRADLDAATAKNNAKAIDKAIDDLVTNQKALWAIDERRFVDLRKVLTPAQAGRLLVVLPALERKVHNMLSRAAANRAGRAGGRGRADDLDDDLDPDE